MPSSRSWRYWLLVAGTTLWLMLLVFPPWIQSRGLPFGDIAYTCFASICHQIPERSFQIWGYPLAICSRCTGLYFGFWIGLLVLPYMTTLSRHILSRPRLLIVFAVPMALDLLLNNTAATRFISGAMASFPVALLVWVAADGLQLRPLLRREKV